MEEIVIRLEEFPDYFVSNTGNVYSQRVSKRHNPNGKMYELKPWDKHPSGYINVGMYNEAGVKNKTYFRLHRLVWEAFNGEIPEGMTIDHINNDKQDNRLENLQLMTLGDNVRKYHHFDKLNKNEDEVD